MPSRFNPDKHHRRSIRLKGYDYASPDAYFVTILTRDRECLFDNLVFRRVAEYNWQHILRHFANVVLDEWVVMPNHLHGIIVIAIDRRKGEAFAKTLSSIAQGRIMPAKISLAQEVANASPLPTCGAPPGALGAIVGNFKSITTRRINSIRKTSGVTIWHRNYYEHIIRNQKELRLIHEYIAANPFRWAFDRENPKTKTTNDDWLADENIWFSSSNLKSSYA